LNAAACTTTTPRCVRSVQSFELSFFTLVLAFDDFVLPIDFVLRIEVPRLRGDVFLVATILSV
jgi:hypothetical protein